MSPAPHCMQTSLLCNPFNQGYSYMSASEIITDLSCPCVCRQVKVSNRLWCQFIRIYIVTQEQYFRMWLSRSGEGSASTLQCDPNKLGTWWYPAMWSGELKGLFGSSQEPQPILLSKSQKACPSNRDASPVGLTDWSWKLYFFFFFFWSQSICRSWDNRLTSGYLAPLLNITL